MHSLLVYYIAAKACENQNKNLWEKVTYCFIFSSMQIRQISLCSGFNYLNQTQNRFLHFKRFRESQWTVFLEIYESLHHMFCW